MTAERLHFRNDPKLSYWDLNSYDRGPSVALDPLQIYRAQQVLTQESTYDWRMESLCMPNFGVLLTARSGDKIVRIALCFKCGQIGVFEGADGGGKRINSKDEFAQTGFLLALATQLFPNDPELGMK